MISVIIPVYNAQKYLEQCIDSILNQSYKDFELILVDDGASDSSPEICDQYAQTDSRVTVYHKINGGVSSARNFGLIQAKGDYVIFIDSDDYIHSDMLQIMISSISNCDMAVCGATIIALNGIACVNKPLVQNNAVMSKQDAAELIIKNLDNALWNKLIKRSTIADLTLDEGKAFGEDYDFLIRVLNNCQNVAFITDNLYYYRKNDTSITASKFSEKRFDQVYYRDKIHDFVSNNFSNLSNYTRVHRFTARLNICRHIFLSGNQSKYQAVLNDYKTFMKNEFDFVKSNLSKNELLEYRVLSLGNFVYNVFVKVLFKR